MELQLKGYLKKEIERLTGRKSFSIKNLISEYLNGNEELHAPLILYVAVYEKETALFQAVLDLEVGDELVEDLKPFLYVDVEAKLASGDAQEEYLNVWNHYVYERDAKVREYEKRNEVRLRILELLQEKNASVRNVCMTVNVNVGNVNAWLKYANHAKISMKTAEQVLKYLESL